VSCLGRAAGEPLVVSPLARPVERESSLQTVSSKDLVMARRRSIVWTDYMKYRARLRGFDLAKIEEIVRHSSERYFDIATGRHVAVGRHGKILVVIPYEIDEDSNILHLALSDEPEAGSVEISPNITAELNDKGELIGIEILNASAFLRDSILESVQAKVLQLIGA